jgi:hypothetical protein
MLVGAMRSTPRTAGPDYFAALLARRTARRKTAAAADAPAINTSQSTVRGEGWRAISASMMASRYEAVLEKALRGVRKSGSYVEAVAARHSEVRATTA